MGIRNDESSRPLCREGTVGGVVCGSKILNSFFSLRAGNGESRGWCKCQTDSSLYAHTAPFGRAVLLGVLGVHSLPLGKERTKKTCKGLCPLTPRRGGRRNCSRLRWETSFPKAALKGVGKCRLSVLFGIASKTGWAGVLCLTSGEHAPRISKKGEYGSKPFCQTAGGYQCALVGGESLDFPTRKSDLRRSFSQPRKNVDKHFCLGAEISIAPAAHLGNPKGRALWSAFLVRSFSDEKE